MDAVLFDLDGVLVDSEELWDRSRRQVVEESGGRWTPEATEAMIGMSSTQWSSYLQRQLDVPLSPAQISAAVVDRLLDRYRLHLPLLPGAGGAVARMAARWPLGLASSSNRPVIDTVLRMAGLDRLFAVTVSSEEVARGKPAPDVYLEAARRLGVDPGRCAVIEDSTNGILAAVSAAMTVVAVPNPHFPPGPDALAMADRVVPTIGALTPEILE